MRDWPTDPNCGVRYEEIIFPLKKIMFEGYRLERLPLKQFSYTGYNIGRDDRLYCPTPEERFSSRWLENEQKFKRTLFDNIILTAFQLGVEQGRRLDQPNRYSHDLLVDILHARTRRIKELTKLLAVYDPGFSEEENIKLETSNPELLIDSDMSDDVDAQNSKED